LYNQTDRQTLTLSMHHDKGKKYDLQSGLASFTHKWFKPRSKLGWAKPVKPSLTQVKLGGKTHFLTVKSTSCFHLCHKLIRIAF